jgi:chromosomal replication initiation ATPase DnaA
MSLVAIVAIRLRERGLLHIVERVATEHRTTVDEVLGRCKQRHIVGARHAAWRALANALPTWSSTSLGDLVGVDHTSILYAIGRTAAARKPVEPPLAKTISRGVQRGMIIAGSRR